MLHLNIVALLASLTLFMPAGASTTRSTQPNILWIIAEDMSPDLGCYGNTLVKTPTLDTLAREGMRFTHMFTTAGVCSPSRTALATGMYQNAIGAMHMRYPDTLKPALPPGVKTVAHILQEHGYQTLGIKKDDYMFKLDRPAFQYRRMDALERGKPFFAKVNSFYTHRIFKQDTEYPIDRSRVTLPPYYPDVRPLREDWAAYLENIQLLDREVKEILADFETRGLLENTIVMVFSDHGRPTLRGKYWMYDSGIRIPFVVHLPAGMASPRGFEPGTVSHQLLSAIDISATTLALAGVPKPPRLHGRVFLGDRMETERDYIFASLDRIGGVPFKTRAVRSRKFKYIKNFNNGWSVLECSTEYRKARLPHYNTVRILDTHNRLTAIQKTLVTPLPLEELYDVESDPFETKNLAYDETFQTVRQELASVLGRWIADMDDKGFYPDSPAIQKHFIDYRTQNQERYRRERLQSYLKIEQQLKQDGHVPGDPMN